MAGRLRHPGKVQEEVNILTLKVITSPLEKPMIAQQLSHVGINNLMTFLEAITPLCKQLAPIYK